MRGKRFLTLPAVMAMAYALSGCHVLRNYNDVAVTRTGGGDVFAFVLRDDDLFNDFSTEFDGWDTVYSDLDANCGPGGNDADGDWGTPGNAMDPPDQTLIDCARDHIVYDDEEDPASLVCEDTDHDCQDEDVPPNYTVINDATQFYYDAVDEDPAQFVTKIRDWWVLSSPETYCLGYTTSAPDWTFHTTCPG